MTLYTPFTRAFALEDISIRSDGTGRTVEAYAAVFGVPQTITDHEGTGYVETISRTAFDRTIAQRSGAFQVMFNHGLDMYGNPSDRFSMPIGTPIEVRADAKGLWTVTRYSSTPLADEVLQLIKDGAIRGQSFSGQWRKSFPERGPYRSGQVVERTEVAMREYGPTPFPAYTAAEIVGVRSAASLVDEISTMTADERAELVRLLGTLTAPADTGTGEDDAPATGAATEPAGATTPPDQTIEIELELARLRQKL